jgi:regulator of protease activity HflC (stomatin/prohibitin superfamily)
MSLSIILITILAFAIITLFKSFFTVSQQSVDIIERFGKYARCAHAGLNFKVPFIERIAGTISLRIYPLDVTLDTKTQDNVIVKVQVSVQYRIKEEGVYDAFYKLENAREQITAYVLDLVRAEVPTMSLDAVFEKKDSIANAVKNELTGTMQEFGYEIVKALVTNIDPDEKVKNAMNEINEQQRLQVAAQAKGEAEKILKVKQAEGEAESKRLQGEGIANQRKAIIAGLQESVGEFQKAIPGVTAADTMNLALITQYFDTLKEIGANNKSTTILLPHSPGGLKDIAAQLQESIITGNLVTNSENSK